MALVSSEIKSELQEERDTCGEVDSTLQHENPWSLHLSSLISLLGMLLSLNHILC